MDLVQSKHDAALKSQAPLNCEYYFTVSCFVEPVPATDMIKIDELYNNNDGFVSPVVDGGYQPKAEVPLNFEGHPQSEYHASHHLPSHIRSPLINKPTLPLPTTIDPRLLQLNHDHHIHSPINQPNSYYQLICRKDSHLAELYDDAFTSYNGLGAQSTPQPANLTSAPTLYTSSLSTSSTIEPIEYAMQPNFVKSVKEMGGSEFKCGFIGCTKIHDRRSRAQACEYRHYGLKAFQCSGACGNLNW